MKPILNYLKHLTKSRYYFLYKEKVYFLIKKTCISIDKYYKVIQPKILIYRLKYRKLLRKTAKLRQKIATYTQKPYFYPLSISISWLLLLIINFQTNRLIYKNEFPELTQLNQYPNNLSKQISLIHKLYEKGYPKLADTFLINTKKALTHKLWLTAKQKRQVNLISTFLTLPQFEKDKRQRLGEALMTTPYSWPLRLEKARLDLEFYKTVSAENNIKTALWLDPNLNIESFYKYIPSLDKKNRS